MEAAKREEGEEHIILTLNLMSQIWKARNGVVFKNNQWNPVQVVNKAVDEWLEFQQVQKEGQEKQQKVREAGGQETRWVPPREGWIKVNSDAALNQKMNKAGWGIVARDSCGNVLSTWAIPRSSCSEARLEEALALRKAMIQARQQGWRRVEFESDCKMIIDKVTGDAEEDSLTSTVIRDIRNLQSYFYKCCFSFARRENNYVSHRIAKFSINCLDDTKWEGNFPAWLTETAQADVRGQLI